MFPKLADLTAELEHKRRSAQEIVDRAEKEGRPHTEEENKLFDDLTAQIATLKGRIADVQATLDRRDRAEQLRKEAESPAGRRTDPDPPANASGVEGSSPRLPAQHRRYGALKAFKGDRAEDRAYRSGLWARAVIFGDERAQRKCLALGITNALSTTSNPAGGVLVPEEMSQAIIDLREIYGVFRRNSRVIPMGSDTMLVPRRVSGPTVAFVGENTEIPESTPGWDNVRLTARKLAGLVRMSTEIDEDAIIDLGDWLAQEFAYQFALKEDQCGFLGDGTSTYGGIVGITTRLNTSGLAGRVVAATNHDTFAEIDASDLAALIGALPEYARPNAKFYASSVGMHILFGRLMSAAGGNTIADVARGYQMTYLGYPVETTQVLSSATTTLSGAVMLLFGDLAKATTFGDRRGISVMPSEHRYFELDQIAIRATERFDINAHDYGDATTAGPMVALVGA